MNNIDKQIEETLKFLAKLSSQRDAQAALAEALGVDEDYVSGESFFVMTRVYGQKTYTYTALKISDDYWFIPSYRDPAGGYKTWTSLVVFMSACEEVFFVTHLEKIK